MTFAPIVLFTFKRPEHTRRALESLSLNAEFTASPLFVYCDGARNDTDSVAVEETRKLVHDWPHPNKTIIERDSNWGLAKSIIAGVTELCEKYGKVIVVEDDLIVSSAFLHYLNMALGWYADESQVMQISGYMFPVQLNANTDAVMLPFTASWGWATWQRAWKRFDPEMRDFALLSGDKGLRSKFDLGGAYPYFKMLKRQREGKIDSWAIRWYLSVFRDNGLVVFPTLSLVSHEGYGDLATHVKRLSRSSGQPVSQDQVSTLPPLGCSIEASHAVAQLFRAERSILARINWRGLTCK